MYIGLRTFREILLYNNPDVQNDPKLGEIIQPFELYEQFSPWGTVLYFDRMIPPE